MARVRLEELHTLAVAVLTASKSSPANAAIVADALTAADADGIPSHGVARLPAYADQARASKVDGFAEPELTRRAKAALWVDAKSGFAYPAIRKGLEAASETVAETGILGLAIHHSHHAGVAGQPVEWLARKGLIGLYFSNSPAAIAPWGGNRAIYGTNPIAFGCPRGDEDPIVVDLSLSEVARGKIKLAADRGDAIPEGWAVDAAGHPTTDAKAALGGSLMPLGGPKGAALVLMVEILAASLTASNHGFEASSFFDAEGPPPHIGQFMIVIDPRAFAGADFTDRLGALMEAFSGQGGTRLPGARRYAIRAASEADGVEVPDGLLADLKARAES